MSSLRSPTDSVGRAHLRRLAGHGLLGLWLVAVIVGGSSLTAAHLATLPGPSSPGVVEGALAAQGTPRWIAAHVLYEGCGCSDRVLARLLERGVHPTIEERVLLVSNAPDPAAAAPARARGYQVEQLTPAALERDYGIRSAPMLVVADPEGRLRYAGGYTDRKRGPEIKDLDILEALSAGRPAEALPLFGCAVSRELQAQIDPLGLKYRASPPTNN